MAQGQVQTHNWSLLRGTHQGISKSWRLSWIKDRSDGLITGQHDEFVQTNSSLYNSALVVYSLILWFSPCSFLWYHFTFKVNLCNFPITNPFPLLSQILKEMGMVLYSGFPKYIAFSYENLLFHAPLSSIGSRSLWVLVESKMVRLMYLSPIPLTTISVCRGIRQNDTLPSPVQQRLWSPESSSWVEAESTPGGMIGKHLLFWSDHISLSIAWWKLQFFQR